MSKIGIVVAMDKEFALFEKLLDEKKDISSAGFKIMTGRMDNKKICLMTSGIGKVAAATGINLLRSLYQPDMVVNSGVAGGLGENLKTGDVIAGTEYVYHDVDCGPGNEYGQVQGFPARFKADARLLEAVSRQGIRSGLFCTGDQFISDPEGGGQVLSLFGAGPRLAGVRPRAAGLEEGDREDLALLAALWETGRLERWGPEFT